MAGIEACQEHFVARTLPVDGFVKLAGFFEVIRRESLRLRRVGQGVASQFFQEPGGDEHAVEAVRGLGLLDVVRQVIGHFGPFLPAIQQFGVEGDRGPRIGGLLQVVQLQFGVAELIVVQEHAHESRPISRVRLSAIDQFFHLVAAAVPVAAEQVQAGQVVAVLGTGSAPPVDTTPSSSSSVSRLRARLGSRSNKRIFICLSRCEAKGEPRF